MQPFQIPCITLAIKTKFDNIYIYRGFQSITAKKKKKTPGTMYYVPGFLALNFISQLNYTTS